MVGAPKENNCKDWSPGKASARTGVGPTRTIALNSGPIQSAPSDHNAVARICLITANHVSFQPRSLREADSLFEAGHDVRVVCRQTDPILTQYDVEIMRTR